MASLFQIDEEILSCVDEETGEVIDVEKLQQLHCERKKKIENIGLWFKNLVSDVQALKAEIDILTERKRKAESRAEQLKALLTEVLDGSKFETSKISMSYRKSVSTEVTGDFVKWASESGHDEFLTYKEPTPNKAAIKDAILNGNEVEFAEIVVKNNLVIK